MSDNETRLIPVTREEVERLNGILARFPYFTTIRSIASRYDERSLDQTWADYAFACLSSLPEGTPLARDLARAAHEEDQ